MEDKQQITPEEIAKKVHLALCPYRAGDKVKFTYANDGIFTGKILNIVDSGFQTYYRVEVHPYNRFWLVESDIIERILGE